MDNLAQRHLVRTNWNWTKNGELIILAGVTDSYDYYYCHQHIVGFLQALTAALITSELVLSERPTAGSLYELEDGMTECCLSLFMAK